MKDTIKKILTVILILAMLLSLGSALVFAEDNGETVSTEETEPQPDPEPEPEPEPEPDEPKGTIKVRYLDQNNREISGTKEHKHKLGTYNFKAISIDGYQLIGPSTVDVTLSEAGQEKTVVFQYKKESGTIKVRYVDENNRDISGTKEEQYKLGTHKFQAISIDGYQLMGPANIEVKLSEAGQQKEVIFQYQKKPEPVPEPEPEPEPEPGPEPTVLSINLVAPPYKTTYLTGEEIDLDGIVVFKELSNGEEEEVPIDELNVIGFNSEQASEEQVVVVSYQGHTAEFTVSIEEGETPSKLPRILFFLLIILILAALTTGTVFLVKKYIKDKKEKGKSEKPKEKVDPKVRRKKIIIISISVIIVLIILSYVGALYLLGRMEREEISSDDDSLGIYEGIGVRGITNIAVFGIDSEDDMRGRSDSIMILTLDEVNDKIKITSIMRDSYIDIPGRGMDKINHAYAFGGPELALKTLNHNFGLDIRHFVSVNFASMPVIIDAVGGVEVHVTAAEAREISGINSEGTHVLTGQQALRFSRIRKIDSDFERARRQRDVMESLINAAFKTPVTSYPRMLNDILPHLTTNLGSNQILTLGGRAVMNNINTVEQIQFPPSSLASGQIINGVYYYVFDLEVGAKKLSDYIYNDIPID